MSRLVIAVTFAALALVGAARPAAAQFGVSDGSSNTVAVSELILGSTGCQLGTVTDGASNTLLVRSGTSACRLPVGPAACALGILPVWGVDGASRTLFAGGRGGRCFAPLDPNRCLIQALPLLGDGSSRSVFVGSLLQYGPETGCQLPVRGAGCALGLASDGTSNTLLVGEAGATAWCTLPVAGTGGLIDVRPDGGDGFCVPRPTDVRDGTSNTLLIGECAAPTPDATVTPEPATVALVAGGGLLLLAVRRRRT